MQKIFELFLIAVVLLFCTSAQAQYNVRIIVYGDSLTAGYQLQAEQAFPAKLSRKLQQVGFAGFEVINMSVVGETTAGGLARIDPLIAKKPDIVVLELGANDVLQGINPGIIQNNLSSIIDRLQKIQSYIILLGMKAPPSRDETYVNQLDSAYQRLAGQVQAFYPFVLEGVADKPELNLADGLHPNSQGVSVMVDNIYPLVDAGLRWAIAARQYQQQSGQ